MIIQIFWLMSLRLYDEEAPHATRTVRDQGAPILLSVR